MCYRRTQGHEEGRDSSHASCGDTRLEAYSILILAEFVEENMLRLKHSLYLSMVVIGPVIGASYINEFLCFG